MAKFKKGDKVRYISGGWYEPGEILYVLAYDEGDHMPYLLGINPTDTENVPSSLWVDEGEFELVEESADEIEEIKQRVSELEAKVKRLESGNRTVELMLDPVKFALAYTDGREEKSANERRKEVIEKAKKFVVDTKTKAVSVVGITKGNETFRKKCTDVDFVINEEKRTVLALIKGAYCPKLYGKGIAKCAPSDVFNVHIGKAIALGRAYGLPTSEFEQAPQPDEVVPGMVVSGSETRGFYKTDKRFTITRRNGKRTFRYAEDTEDFIYDSQIGEIISDSEAQY